MLAVHVFGSIMFLSLISLVVLFLYSRSSQVRKLVPFFVSLAVGSLLGEAFIHAIPEALEAHIGHPAQPVFLVLVGLLMFFFLEKCVHWHHAHTVGGEVHIQPVGYLVVVGGILHNFLDGVLIASAFMASPVMGLSTVTAILLHEIPQEISSFGIVLSMGMSVRRAIFMNLVTAGCSIFGATIVMMIGVGSLSQVMIPISAGGFMYIAASDLIPELHKEQHVGRSLGQCLMILFGILLMSLLKLFS